MSGLSVRDNWKWLTFLGLPVPREILEGPLVNDSKPKIEINVKFSTIIIARFDRGWRLKRPI